MTTLVYAVLSECFESQDDEQLHLEAIYATREDAQAALQAAAKFSAGFLRVVEVPLLSTPPQKRTVYTMSASGERLDREGTPSVLTELDWGWGDTPRPGWDAVEAQNYGQSITVLGPSAEEVKKELTRLKDERRRKLAQEEREKTLREKRRALRILEEEIRALEDEV